tara:strand:+ start:8534 stop:9010 length:477 start_codon:yes stop_codon:yes gene_type:complete
MFYGNITHTYGEKMNEFNSTCSKCGDNLCEQLDYPYCDGWYKSWAYFPEPNPEVEEGRLYVYVVSDKTILCSSCFEEIWKDLSELTAPKDVCKICHNPETLVIQTHKVLGQRWEPETDFGIIYYDEYCNIIITKPFPIHKKGHICICKHHLQEIKNLN